MIRVQEHLACINDKTSHSYFEVQARLDLSLDCSTFTMLHSNHGLDTQEAADGCPQQAARDSAAMQYRSSAYSMHTQPLLSMYTAVP